MALAPKESPTRDPPRGAKTRTVGRTVVIVEVLRSGSLVDADPEIAALNERRARAPARRARADRLGELRLAGRAGGAGLGAHQQVRRGLPGQALLRRLRVVDVVETLAIERAKELFGAEHANVQPHSGAQANMAVYIAVLEAGRHDAGHGPRPRRPPHPRPPGQLLGQAATTSSSYGVRPRRPSASTTTRCATLAREHSPKLIVAGATAYPRIIDFARVPRDRRRGRRAADGRHGAHRRPGRRAACTRPRCRTPTSSPPPRTRRCAARAAA